MRVAQRSQGFHNEARQQIEIFTGVTPQDAALKLSELIASRALQVVALSHWHHTSGIYTNYGITAVLEEEPV